MLDIDPPLLFDTPTHSIADAYNSVLSVERSTMTPEAAANLAIVVESLYSDFAYMEHTIIQETDTHIRVCISKAAPVDIYDTFLDMWHDIRLTTVTNAKRVARIRKEWAISDAAASTTINTLGQAMTASKYYDGEYTTLLTLMQWQPSELIRKAWPILKDYITFVGNQECVVEPGMADELFSSVVRLNTFTGLVEALYDGAGEE